jgi:TRAP-type C4-dicarboxylate transport system permease small subunit
VTAAPAPRARPAHLPLADSAVVRGVDRAVGVVSLGMSLVGTVAIGLMGALIVADIIGRSAFSYPIVGTVEIAKTSIVAITFLTLPYAMRRSSHVRSTVILSRLSPRPALVMTVLSTLLGAAVFALIAYASWEPTLHAIAAGEYEGEGALRVPTWPTGVTIVAGSVVMVVECLLTPLTGRAGTGEVAV